MAEFFPDRRGGLCASQVGISPVSQLWLAVFFCLFCFCRLPALAASPEQFGAAGDGRTDDTAAWQRALDKGGTITADRLYKITDTLTAKVPGTIVTGKGRLVETDAFAHKSLLVVAADGCTVRGLKFTNPTETQSATGERNAGIYINANKARIIGNNVDRFQEGIVVSAYGEFFDNLIQGNTVSNVLGVGGTADDVPTSRSVTGEDRGDGIMSWGSRTTIVGNTVFAHPGMDARIGIHVEGLADLHRHPNSPDDEKGAEIRGNTVSGPFRRGIVDEAVRDVNIKNNRLPGGYGWWGIAIVQGVKGARVEDNQIVFDRAVTNQAGARWSPAYAAIQVAGYKAGAYMQDVTIRGNDIKVTNGGGVGIMVLNTGRDPATFTGIHIIANRIAGNGGRFASIKLVNAPLVETEQNAISGAWGAP